VPVSDGIVVGHRRTRTTWYRGMSAPARVAGFHRAIATSGSRPARAQNAAIASGW
jgi:hypothetical protein